MPDELHVALKEDKQLQDAFNVFTPSKQREFAEHISQAKQVATKMKRLEKIKPMIVAGIGLHDKYKNC